MKQSILFIIIIAAISLGWLVFNKPLESVNQTRVITSLPPLDIDEPVRAYSDHTDGYVGLEEGKNETL